MVSIQMLSKDLKNVIAKKICLKLKKMKPEIYF